MTQSFPCRLHSIKRVLAVAGSTFFKDALQECRDLAAGVYQVSFELLNMVICPLLLVKHHKTQTRKLTVYRRALGQLIFTFHFLRYTSHLVWLVGARLRQFLSKRSCHFCSLVSLQHSSPAVGSPISQTTEYSCDHKPLTYEESSTRGCEAPSPLYTRRNIANTSDLSAGALLRRILEPNLSPKTTNSATAQNRKARCLQSEKRNRKTLLLQS